MHRNLRLLADTTSPAATRAQVQRLEALLAKVERRNQHLRRQVATLRAQLKIRRLTPKR
jgi:16S rRNA G1207 methylase RsmC